MTDPAGFGTAGSGTAVPWAGSASVGRLPRIEFGRGRIERLPSITAAIGRHALVVTGARSFRETARWPVLVSGFEEAGLTADGAIATGEPSPALIDGLVAGWRGAPIDVVVGIGGGSVLDTAKAVAGLLRSGTFVMDHLEVVGRGLPYEGPAVPFVAVPTTAGTGSEATKNAVVSERGPHGFKRSFRDDRLVATVAVIDPDLLDDCPGELVAADGMDAVTQLLEAYVSTGAGPVTDALALAGLEAARDALLPWFEAGPGAGEGSAGHRERMAFAALASGICLAHAGLGIVHGLAAPLGARLPVPHGVACGTALAPATAANLRALREREPTSQALARYARVGRLLLDRPGLDDRQATEGLVGLLEEWSRRLALSRLRDFGLDDEARAWVVANARAGSTRTNPVALTDEEVAAILAAAA